MITYDCNARSVVCVTRSERRFTLRFTAAVLGCAFSSSWTLRRLGGLTSEAAPVSFLDLRRPFLCISVPVKAPVPPEAAGGS